MISDPLNTGGFSITGKLVDVHNERILPARVDVDGGIIARIEPTNERVERFLLPGFVDAHIHIESSMLTPGHFAQAAVVHGTVATVSDPHEIANVLGLSGVQFMIEDARQAPLKICFGAPSCVPATRFESSGATLDVAAVTKLLEHSEIGYLSEVMDFPGVLAAAPDVLAKIAAARRCHKPVDGHAPGLRGTSAQQYIAAGITTDHECTTLEEATDKLQAGAMIQIREGSAARNFDALYTLMNEHAERCMLCSDDLHPDDFALGHINRLAARAVAGGQPLMQVLRSACVTPVEHYDLPVGLLRAGDPADFIVVEDLTNFEVRGTYLNGELAAHDGLACFDVQSPQPINQFHAQPLAACDFEIPAASNRILAIEAVDGELITRSSIVDAKIENGLAVSHPQRDLLKIVVVNRYQRQPPAVAFIRNFGLQQGAIASSVAHDSHNIVAVGTTDNDLCAAVNQIVAHQGGLAVAAGSDVQCLPLPIAGLMSVQPLHAVSQQYTQLSDFAKRLGTQLRAPFMTLSFMALLVIPQLKLSDRGLFDVNKFDFVSVFV